MKLKLISALSALAIGTGCLAAIPAILNTTNNVSTQQNDANKVIETDNIKHSSNVQVVNSVDQIVVDKIYGNHAVSAAIVSNNGKQEIYVWGRNDEGQLGLGDTNSHLVPTLLDSSSLGNYLSIKELILSNSGQITSSNTTAIVNTLKGEQIYVWGYNEEGHLGIGNFINQSSPVLFNTKQFGDYTRIKTISFNSSYKWEFLGTSYAILETLQGIDKFFVWGSNGSGKLGLGDFANRNTPILFDTTQFGTFKSIKQFVIGYASYAIIEDNTNNEKLYMWGANWRGTCATGDLIDVTTPRLLSSSIFNGAKIKFLKILLGSSFLVLTRNGVDELYTWGNNMSGQLGNGNYTNQTSPFRVSQSTLGNANEIIDINGEDSMMVQVKINGTPRIYAWGNNSYGQLGLGDSNYRTTPTLFDNSRLGNFTEFYDWSLNSSKYSGAYSNFAYVKTLSGDSLYVWGYNVDGQLGLGDKTNRYSPTQVSSLNLSTAKIKNFSQSIVFTFNLTLDRNGQSESYATGYNGNGQIGNGNTTHVSSFTQILPTRYTKPQSKLVNPTANISSAQALELINPNNTLNRTELDNYVDTTSFPTGSVLSIDPTTTNADYKNGVLNLGITTNQYNDLLIVDTVAQPKTFNVTINGFRPVTDISTNPVTTIIRDADGTNIDKIYDQVVDSTYKVVNRNLLEYYFDLSSIPPNAVIYLYRTSLGNDMEATFTLTASQVYDNTGLIVNQLYIKSDLVWTLTNQPNLALIISLSVVGGLVLIGSIVAIILVKRSPNKQII